MSGGHQRATIKMRMQLLLELFVNDLARSREFCTRVLGFEIREQKARGYTGMQNGDPLISLNDRRQRTGHTLAQDGIAG